MCPHFRAPNIFSGGATVHTNFHFYVFTSHKQHSHGSVDELQ